MVKAVCSEKASKKLTTVPLSNNTLQRKIVKLSSDVKDQIVIKLKEFVFFADSWVNRLVLLASHNCLHKFDLLATTILKNIFLFCQPLSTTTFEDILNVVDKLFRENTIGPNVLVFVQMALQV